MKVPNIQFNESNVGLTPVRSGIRNRIGIVGEFSRGPANVASFITGYTDFANRYGSDLKKGSLAFQAAFDQGAEDFCLVRVLGHAKLAKGSVRFANPATKANKLFFHLRFIGNPIDISATPMSELVTSSGKYTATVSGRYYFYVSAIAASSATVKFTFLPLGVDPATIVWASITTSIAVDINLDKGVAKAVENGISLYFGTASQTNSLTLKIGDSWSIRVNADRFVIDINEGDLPNQVVTTLIDNLSGVTPLGEIERNAQDDGVVFAVDPQLGGEIGNKYSYYFELQDTVAPGISITPIGAENAAFMQGGEDGPRNAVRDFYNLQGVPLLRLVAVSEGSWGNQLRISIYPINNKQFRLYIEDLNAGNFNPKLESESYIINLAECDDQGFLDALKASNFVRGIFLPKYNSPTNFNIGLTATSPQRLAPANALITDPTDPAHPDYYGPTKLVQVSMLNGYEGPELTEVDYIKALAQLESEPVHIVLAAGIYESLNVKAALITHAENSRELEGLRIAVLNARPGLSPNAAKQETLGFVSKRAVMVAGWATYAGQPNATRFTLDPAAVYAGKLAATPFFAGPNARRTAGAVLNVTEVDTKPYCSMNALQIFTDARLEVLGVDPAIQTYVFINGRTLSNDSAWDKIFIRRTYDVIRMDLFELLQQYKSEPHTNLLRVQIVAAINAYMTEKLRASHIANFKPAIADSSNNTPENYINGELNVSLSFLPLYAADYINVTLIRDSASGLVSFGA